MHERRSIVELLVLFSHVAAAMF